MNTFLNRAKELDLQDPLASYKSAFRQDDSVIYLDGNSLGKMPMKAEKIIQEVVQYQWNERLIRSWNERWLDLPKRLAADIAKIVGAKPTEIFVGDSTTIQLYKLAFGALQSQKNRSIILTDTANFPTDKYILQGLISTHFTSHTLHLLDTDFSANEQIKQVVAQEEIALAVLSHVQYKSGFKYDMESVTKAAQEAGTRLIWDVSHAVGAVELEFNRWGVEAAVGCTYKYLNGGPGAPAFLYVREDVQKEWMNPIWGWFSHAQPFQFADTYDAHTGIEKYATGTPNVLSLAGMEAGIALTAEVGMCALQAKSQQMMQFLEEMVEVELVTLGFSQITPKNPQKRGSHLTLSHPDGLQISKALTHGINGVSLIPDFRPPSYIRLGLTPLYTSFEDLVRAVELIKEVVVSKKYQEIEVVIGEVP